MGRRMRAGRRMRVTAGKGVTRAKTVRNEQTVPAESSGLVSMNGYLAALYMGSYLLPCCCSYAGDMLGLPVDFLCAARHGRHAPN